MRSITRVGSGRGVEKEKRNLTVYCGVEGQGVVRGWCGVVSSIRGIGWLSQRTKRGVGESVLYGWSLELGVRVGVENWLRATGPTPRSWRKSL